MNVLHLLAQGGIGGIENLCKDYVTKSEHRHVVVCMWDGGDVANEMLSRGVKLVVCNYSKKNIIQTMKFLLELCKQENIDVVVTQHESPILHMYMMWIKKMRPSIFTLAYAHSNALDMCDPKRKKGFQMRKCLLSFFFRKADYVIAISNAVKKSLIEYFKVSEDNINVIYNGVDTKKYCIGQTKYSSVNTCELIYVGRLIVEKGIQNIIHVLHELPDNLPWHLSIVGDGPYKEVLIKQIETYKLSNRIDLLGNRRDVDVLLRKADIFIHLPNWEEGFGITIIEAMASGKICICNDKGAIPEIIISNETGFIVPANNPKLIKECIEKTIRNIDLPEYDLIRKCAVERAHQFDIDNYISSVDRLITRICNKER